MSTTIEHAAWQADRFRSAPDTVGMVWHDREFTYGDFLTELDRWRSLLDEHEVQPGDSVGVLGDYSPRSVTCLLALLERRCILVPLSWESRDQHEDFFGIAELDVLIEMDREDGAEFRRMDLRKSHPMLEELRARDHAGLCLFSSGSTGKPKGMVHDLEPLLEKFRKPRKTLRTINFLLFDHIGGVNTIFYTLANLGCTVVPLDRSVSEVCRAVEAHGVELLPTSPSFLNLMLLANAADQRDLSSLKLITYGTEVMPERTLRMATEAFPEARFQQTYGLSELGILRSKSKDNASLFVRVGGEGFETRVVDGTLRIRAKSSMLGYLNAPSPFDEEGWFDTGDAVIEEGEFYRILGRESDLINVGGQKVFPAEVERVISEMPEVIEVAVRGEEHMILGQVVVATVQMAELRPAVEVKRAIAKYAKGRLQRYMVPSKVEVVTESPVNYRFKKVRR